MRKRTIKQQQNGKYKQAGDGPNHLQRFTYISKELIRNDYTAENGEKLKQLLRCPDDKLADLTKRLSPIEHATMGPARLEGCMSKDHLFVALQLFGYSDFEYSPLTDVRIYEGMPAELISTII